MGTDTSNRLFSADEVYKTALKNEPVKLGIPPSRASDAVNAAWAEWGKKDVPKGRLRGAVAKLMISGLWRCVRKNSLVDHYINSGARPSNVFISYDTFQVVQR
jgi:hypothetical protein